MGGCHSVEVPGGGTTGYNVMKVRKNSPAFKAGLEVWFDWIIVLNNNRFDQEDGMLTEILITNIDQALDMLVYSSKTRTVRKVTVTPSTTWGGEGLLGISTRFDSFENSLENVWRILEIQPDSPAEKAGLKPFDDYVVVVESAIRESENFFTFIEAHYGRKMIVAVYNVEIKRCRDVVIVPDPNWGGKGSLSLGCRLEYLDYWPQDFEWPIIVESSDSVVITESNNHGSMIFRWLKRLRFQPSPARHQEGSSIP